MNEMTSYQRFRHRYAHREADGVPVIDRPWIVTI